jgi:hypothetical protein
VGPEHVKKRLEELFPKAPFCQMDRSGGRPGILLNIAAFICIEPDD